MSKRNKQGYLNNSIFIPASEEGETKNPLEKAANLINPIPLNPLPTLSLSKTLNELFENHIENIKDCLLFLERFVDNDPSVKKLIETYKGNESRYMLKSTSSLLDLDLLARDAGLTNGEFRRMMWSTLDMRGDEEVLAILLRGKPAIVQTAIQIALTPEHPDSYAERNKLMQYFGFAPINKGQLPPQVNVNVNTSNEVNNQNNQVEVGLPNFSNQIKDNEKLIAEQMKEMMKETQQKQLQGNKDNVIDINEFSIVKEER